MIFMRANGLRGPFEGPIPNNRDFFGPLKATEILQKSLILEKCKKCAKIGGTKILFSSYSHPLGPKEHLAGWGSSDL